MLRSVIALPFAVTACAAPPPAAPTGLSLELAGRTAGAPQRCILIERGEALRVAEGDRNMLLYGGGGTIWANRLPQGCTMGSRDVLIVEPIGSQFCRGDLVRSIDALSHLSGPACALGDFVPYTY